jgi:hypothetical protein
MAEFDSRQWLKLDWIDQYSGKQYRLGVTGDHGSRSTARAKTYDEIVSEYGHHPESKCSGSDGSVCRKPTVGLLQRRHILIAKITYIGKESNSLEAVESGLIHSEQNVYTVYPDPRRDEWQTNILPAIRKLSLSQLAKLSGMSESALKDLRAGRSRPQPKNQELLAGVVKKLQNKFKWRGRERAIAEVDRSYPFSSACSLR